MRSRVLVAVVITAITVLYVYGDSGARKIVSKPIKCDTNNDCAKYPKTPTCDSKRSGKKTCSKCLPVGAKCIEGRKCCNDNICVSSNMTCGECITFGSCRNWNSQKPICSYIRDVGPPGKCAKCAERNGLCILDSDCCPEAQYCNLNTRIGGKCLEIDFGK